MIELFFIPFYAVVIYLCIYGILRILRGADNGNESGYI